MKSSKILLVAGFVGILMSGCGGSSSSGGGGGGGSVTPTLPADATVIDQANATPIAESAVELVGVTGELTNFRTEASTAPSAAEVMRRLVDKAFNRKQRSSIPSGATEICSGGGSVTANYTETASSASGSILLANCIEDGVGLNGGFNFNSSWNDSTGTYSDSGNGSLTMSFGAQSFTMVIDLAETGNEFNGSFSTNVSLSVSGIPGGNYLLTTTQNITGVFSSVNSGQLLIQGAANTRLRITVVSPGVADVYRDDGNGTFMYHSTILV